VKDYHINIFYSEADGGYIADIPDLEACSAFGETPEEALLQVQIAKEAWLQAESQWDQLVENSQTNLVEAAQRAKRQIAEGQATSMDLSKL